MEPAAAAVALGSISFHLTLLASCEFPGKASPETGFYAHPLPAVPPSQQPLHPPHSPLRAALAAEGHSYWEASRQGCHLTAQGITPCSLLVSSDPSLGVWALSLEFQPLLVSLITCTPARTQRQDYIPMAYVDTMVYQKANNVYCFLISENNLSMIEWYW